ncbi:outer membrane homotrimeric porin [Desulfovibrio desulfuricans]|uniref:outer membrane homotrimeric porin n=1 Tax=Desulfovibrio desulfuricans TaxID=876 RepID=UPI0003B5CF64|nr:outer membrane homotrimeric porin [Desulfovibrio desulfuricans]
MKAVRNNVLGVLLAGGLLFAPEAAEAVDFKVKGAFDVSFEASNVMPRGIKGSDTFGAIERLRTQIDAIASENVSGSLMFTVGTGTMNWGKSGDGASLGADSSKNLGVRHAYIDWLVPKTDIKVRMGMQPQLLPGYVTGWSAVYGQYSTGVTVSSPLVSSGDYKMGLTGFWARPYNDNSEITQNGQTQKNYLDNLDLLALTLPITGNGMKITPWGMYGLIGENSLRGINNNTEQREPAIYAPRGGLMPVLGSGGNYVSTFEKKYRNANNTWGNGFWGGLTSDITAFEPFDIAAEFTYGRVDMGELKDYTQFSSTRQAKTFDLVRQGWYAALRVDYKCTWGTPGVTAWYGSGDDSNPYNGSERLPVFNSPWPVTPLGFGGGFFDLNTWKVLGHNPGGLAGVVGTVKDVSFIDDLTHTFKLAYFHGTNSAEMPRKANMTSYPSRADGPMAYLTTTDHAWEGSVSNTYKIYDNLLMNVEAAYVNLHLDGSTWRGVEDSQYRDNWRVSLSFRYQF